MRNVKKSPFFGDKSSILSLPDCALMSQPKNHQEEEAFLELNPNTPVYEYNRMRVKKEDGI
jgi:hypothetical protein